MPSGGVTRQSGSCGSCKEAIVCFRRRLKNSMRGSTMTDPTMTLMEYLGKIGVDLDGDLLSQGTQLFAQLAVELEAEEQIGAGRYERNPERRTYRSGHRHRIW